MNVDQQLDRVVRFYETLAPETVAQVCDVYTPDAFFKDPFNEVRGHAAIAAIFEHMFEQVEQPRFIVTSRMARHSQAFLLWEFHFRLRGLAKGGQTIRGVSHLRFGADGRLDMHRDYWDTAEELYQKIPVLGGLMRWLKARGRGRRAGGA